MNKTRIILFQKKGFSPPCVKNNNGVLEVQRINSNGNEVWRRYYLNDLIIEEPVFEPIPHNFLCDGFLLDNERQEICEILSQNPYDNKDNIGMLCKILSQKPVIQTK